MTVYRHYKMTGASGQGEALRDALAGLATHVRLGPGCIGVELLRDDANPESFVFIEKWESIDAHKNARNHLPKACIDPVHAALATPPEGIYLNLLKSY